MLHLMRLEIKKYKLYECLPKVLVTILILAGFNILMMYTSYTDPEEAFQEVNDMIVCTEVVTRCVFLIFSSVILAKLTVHEYQKKTILLMFTYPVNRKKLFLAKLSIVFLFTWSTTVISQILLCYFIGIVNQIAGYLPGSFTLGMLVVKIPQLMIDGIICGFISLIPFSIGMIKKSTSATIVTAVLCATLLSSSFSSSALSEENYTLRLFAFGIAAIIVVAFTFLFQINQLEDGDV